MTQIEYFQDFFKSLNIHTSLSVHRSLFAAVGLVKTY